MKNYLPRFLKSPKTTSFAVFYGYWKPDSNPFSRAIYNKIRKSVQGTKKNLAVPAAPFYILKLKRWPQSSTVKRQKVQISWGKGGRSINSLIACNLIGWKHKLGRNSSKLALMCKRLRYKIFTFYLDENKTISNIL